MPLGAAIVGANVHDSKLVTATFEESLSIFESQGLGEVPDGLCLDKGYDFDRVRKEVKENGLTPHIRSRGEEIAEKTHPARRWVVEHTIAWLKGFRAIRTRYFHYLRNFLAMLQLACAIILIRRGS